jgi:hypothetical protein
MSRTRVISATESLYAGSSPATGAGDAAGTGVFQLFRVQSCTQGWNLARTDVNQFGALAPVSREINTAPTVTLDFSYFLTNLLNEQRLGFVVDGSTSCISHLLDKTQDERNYYLTQAPEGDDDINYTGTDRSVMGIGNGFISSYSTEAAVNGFPTSTVRVEGLNIASYLSSTGQQSPAVNPVDGSKVPQTFSIPVAITGVAGQVPILKHGDITLSLVNPQVGVAINDAKIQRYTLAFNLAREPQEKIGSKFAFSREIRFPIAVSLTVDANVGDMTSGNLADILCNDQFYNLHIGMAKPQCTGVGTEAVGFSLRNAKLDSQNFNTTIGPNKTVAMVWSANIGGPQDTLNGLFMSGTLT